MSLATRQLLLQAQSDHSDVLRRLATGEDSVALKNLLAGIGKRIEKFQKTLDAELAQAKAKAAPAPPSAPKQNSVEMPRHAKGPLPPLPTDVHLPCTDCTNTFVWSGKDQLFFQKQGWGHAPARCSECREEHKQKKSAKPAGATMTCCDCKAEFFFSEDKQRLFAQKGYDAPKRCGPCAKEQKSLVPLTLICACCSKESTFSVKAQKDFKAKGWQHPKICVACREMKKAEHLAAEAAAATAAAAAEAPVTTEA